MRYFVNIIVSFSLIKELINKDNTRTIKIGKIELKKIKILPIFYQNIVSTKLVSHLCVRRFDLLVE